MKRYSEYKDSGVKWIGEIPGHWKIMRLRAYLSMYSEKNHPDKQLLSVTRESGVIVRNTESKEENHNYIPDDLSGYKLVRIGDFAINKMKSWQGSYGVSNFEGIVSPAYYVCKLKFPYKDFFSNAIRCKAYIPFFTQYSKGIRVDQWDLSPIALKNIPFFEPPLPEQEAIVTYLDSKVAKIDEYISIAEKKIAALEELKQTIIAEAVTRGIHKDVPMKDSGVKWIGMIPEHWDLIRAQNMVDCRKAGAWGEDSRKDERDRICLRIADFDYSICRFKRTGDYTIRNYKQEQISSLYLNKGDILIEKSGGGEKTPVGRAILYDLDFYQPLYANFMEKITLREFASSSFYVYLLRTFYAKGCVWKYIKQTTGLQNLDLRAMLGSETFPVPPLPEQQEIVTYIEAKVANINQLCQAERSQIEKLKEYKQRLISDVVTGKVKVTND